MDYAQSKEIIHATAILSDADTAFIDDSIAKIQDNWNKNQLWRTETEMRVSVLNDVKFPTQASKYWQSVREQAVFYEQLVHESFQYRRNEIKLARLHRDLESEEDELTRAELGIDIEEAEFSKMHMVRAAKDRVREIRLWQKIMDECVAADSTFDTDRVDTHQLTSYLWRWHYQLKGMDKSKSSVSEINNLVGQYVSAMREVVDRGGELPLPIRTDAKNLGVDIPVAITSSVVQGITASFEFGVD